MSQPSHANFIYKYRRMQIISRKIKLLDVKLDHESLTAKYEIYEEK